jgi:hypothetical protein
MACATGDAGAGREGTIREAINAICLGWSTSETDCFGCE